MGKLFTAHPSGVSRRSLLVGTGALGASLAIGGWPQVSLAQEAPKRGGIARVALSAFNPRSTLDPAIATSDFDLIAGGLLYDNLIKLDTSFAPQPALAENWEADAAAQHWTFHLRPGVTFHDGAELTSADVVATIQRVLDPATGSSAQSGLAQNVAAEDVTAPDAHTVEFALKAPNAFFHVVLGGFNLRITKAGQTPSNESAVGTGPFVLRRFVPGEVLSVVRNENYWGDDGPYLDGVEILAIAEEAAKLQAVLSGDVDLADSIGVTSVRQIEASSDAQVYRLKNAAMNVIAVQQSVAPYDQLAVRQALKHAIDREALVNVVLQGQGSPGADIPFASDDALFPSGFAGLTYDPEKAKSLLAGAGLSDLEVVLYTSDAAAFMSATSVAVQDMMSASGIRMRLESIPASTYFADIWMKKPMFSSFWLRQHPDTLISLACESTGSWNEAQFADARFDDLVRQARQTADVAQQRTIYAEAMPILAENSGWIVPQWSDRMWPAKSRLKGVRLDFINNADLAGAWLE